MSDESPGARAKAEKRLKRAVEDMVAERVDSAATYVEDAAERLKDKTGRHKKPSPSSRRDDADDWDWPEWRPWPGSRELMRDPDRGKIGGVCAGLANYFGVETWVVRLIAVTGLIFLPSVVFPAYWIAFFVMDKPGDGSRRQRRRRRQRDHARGGQSFPNESSSSEKQDVQAAFEQWDGRPPRRQGRHADVSPAPELGHRLSPRRSLRHVRADFDQIELRLRRIETHVTSGRYELQRELSRIERSEP